MNKITNGNFKDIIDKRNGNLWVLGHFIEPGSPFQTNDLEIKWGLHHPGESKDSPGTNLQSKTLTFLIRGKVSLKFPDQNQEIVLEKEGDYTYWDRGVNHSWSVLEETLIITIR
ncbi:signal peptidase I [Patescibacteria group bacterium]|nr:signal peptidase I [Patescibacteria group bacterium]